MSPLNQKKRLISIFQFIGVYVLGLVFLGFAISSFTGVKNDEKEALKNQVKELKAQILVQDSVNKVEEQHWKHLINKAIIADSMALSIQNLEKELSAALALGEAGVMNAADRREDIEGVERKIRYELRNMEALPEASPQAMIGKNLAAVYQKMMVAKGSLRALQSNRLREDEANEAAVENTRLRNEIANLQTSQQNDNKLNTCNLTLSGKKQKIEEFAEAVKGESALIKKLVEDLQEIQENIKSFLGNDKNEKNNLKNKIAELEKVAVSIDKIEAQMRIAVK